MCSTLNGMNHWKLCLHRSRTSYGNTTKSCQQLTVKWHEWNTENEFGQSSISPLWIPVIFFFLTVACSTLTVHIFNHHQPSRVQRPWFLQTGNSCLTIVHKKMCLMSILVIQMCMANLLDHLWSRVLHKMKSWAEVVKVSLAALKSDITFHRYTYQTEQDHLLCFTYWRRQLNKGDSYQTINMACNWSISSIKSIMTWSLNTQLKS